MSSQNEPQLPSADELAKMDRDQLVKLGGQLDGVEINIPAQANEEDTLFGSMERPFPFFRTTLREAWAPALDVYEKEGEMVIRLDLPGIEKKDVKVKVQDDVLTIEGERKFEKKIEDESYLCREAMFGAFLRRIALPNPAQISLRGRALDHVFGELPANATFSVAGKSQKIEVVYGPKYRVAVVYAPQGPNRDFICFEPMTGPTNAFNLAHRGIYREMQTIPAGQSWQESFWVRTSGF